MPSHIATALRRLSATASAVALAALLAACGPTVTGAAPALAPQSSVTAASTTADPTTADPTTAAPAPTAQPTTAAPTTPAPTHPAPPRPSTARPTAPRPTTARPTTARPAPPKPAPTRAATTCEIVSAAGNCYKAGQFCRNSDLGAETHDADGNLLRCAVKSGRPHWGYV